MAWWITCTGPDPLFRVYVAIPSGSRYISVTEGSQTCPQRELPSATGNYPAQKYTPCPSPPTMGQPTSSEWLDDAGIWGPSLGHFWRAIPDLEPSMSCDLTAGQLLHLRIRILPSSLPYIAWEPSLVNPLDRILQFWVYSQEAQPKMDGVYQTRPRQEQSQEAEQQVAEASCEPQVCMCWCGRGSVTCQIQRMATLNPVITHHEGMMPWMFQFALRDFCYLINPYKIWWKAKWNLECHGRSEGIILE